MTELYIVEWLVEHYDHGDLVKDSVVIRNVEDDTWQEYGGEEGDMLLFYSKNHFLNDFQSPERVKLTYIGEL